MDKFDTHQERVNTLSAASVFVTVFVLFMRLIEKDAKALLAAQGIQTPSGFFVDWETSAWPAERAWKGDVFLKSQVLAGRRGKGGLVQRVSSPEGFVRVLQELKARLTPEECAGFWCEEACPHAEEWFLASDLDRVQGEARLHVSMEGGKEVSTVRTYRVSELEQISADILPQGIVAFLQTLARAMVVCDALSIEINPAVLRTDGTVMALDAKVELDEAASFRHPEWEQFSSLSRVGMVVSPRERAYLELLANSGRPLLGKYVELSGTIGVILAGGGASLVAMDALSRAGGRAANYLELSGNPDPVFLGEATKIVCTHPDLKALWIAGSFANFTDIQATLAAILKAVEEIGLRVPIVVRRDGPGADQAEREAAAWSERTGIPLVFARGTTDLTESAQTVVRLSVAS